MAGILSKVLPKAAEQFAKFLADQVLQGSVTNKALRDAISGPFGVAAATVVDNLVHVVSRVDEVNEKVDKLLREPFVTGVRIVERTYTVQWVGTEQQRVRAEELKTADRLLESAYSLSDDYSSRYVVRLMQLLCVADEQGAGPKFRRYVEELRVLQTNLLDDIANTIQHAEVDLVQLREKLLRWNTERHVGEPAGFANWMEGGATQRVIKSTENRLHEAQQRQRLLQDIGKAIGT